MTCGPSSAPGGSRCGPNARWSASATPSFERVGADGVSDCWQRATDPGNEGGFARAGFGHSGSSAEQLEITSYAGGGRTLLADVDRPDCALPAQVGHSYRLSARYQMTPYDAGPPQVRLIAYVQSASTGAWRPLAESPPFPAAPGWRTMTWETPPIPADAAALSGGVTLQSPGLLTVDDMMSTDVGP